MANTENQRQAFEFLRAHFQSQEPFTRDEFRSAIPDWKPKSVDTYWSKQIKRLVAPAGGKQFRVTEAFRPFANWSNYRKHIATQVRQAYSDYTSLTYDYLIIYEFYMPLTNEGHLRTSLDAMFYKDTIESRLRSVGHEEVMKHFPIKENEAVEVYLDRTCAWISNVFGGYSISHVSGRFRAAPLASMAQVAQYQINGDRYLVDETTAVVRFIFPCGDPHESSMPVSRADIAEDVYSPSDQEPDEADRIRWFFRVLFVQSILQVVNGEDEIWMVESGMRNRLHIWRVPDEG